MIWKFIEKICIWCGMKYTMNGDWNICARCLHTDMLALYKSVLRDDARVRGPYE